MGIKEFLNRNSGNFIDAGLAGAVGLGTGVGLKAAGIDVDPEFIFVETIKLGATSKGVRAIINNVDSWRSGSK